MNVRQHESSGEAHGKPTSWYSPHQPETTTAAPVRYESEAVERILAQANDLQEAHRQTLSEAQIHAVAAEVGIGPEFVRAALLREKTNALGETRPVQVSTAGSVSTQTNTVISPRRTAAVIAGYGVLLTLFLMVASNSHDYGYILYVAFILPAILALVLGAGSESRRRGLISGAALASAVIAAVGLSVR